MLAKAVASRALLWWICCCCDDGWCFPVWGSCCWSSSSTSMLTSMASPPLWRWALCAEMREGALSTATAPPTCAVVLTGGKLKHERGARGTRKLLLLLLCGCGVIRSVPTELIGTKWMVGVRFKKRSHTYIVFGAWGALPSAQVCSVKRHQSSFWCEKSEIWFINGQHVSEFRGGGGRDHLIPGCLADDASEVVLLTHYLICVWLSFC